MTLRKTASPAKTAKVPAKLPAKAPAARGAAAKTGAPRAPTKKADHVLPEERRRFIAEAAYFRAERRGFANGGDLGDWVEAEAEIDALLNTRGAG